MKNYFFLICSVLLLAGLVSCNGGDENEPQDTLKPQITVSSPSATSTLMSGDQLSFDVLFADDKGLANITISSEELSIAVSEDLAGELSYQYTGDITITGEEGTYEISITGTDKSANSATKSISVTIVSTPTYTGEVYAVGDVSWNGWDQTKAMPMVANAEDADWFEITLYSDGDDDGVKFIGQLDWAPNNWGLVDTNDPSQGMVNADNSGKILLEAGYNLVRFNPSTLEYAVTPITTELPAPNGQFHIMGCGFKQTDGSDIDLCWDPSKAYAMTQDDKNPYLYRLTVNFSDATDLKFNGNRAWDALDWGFPEAFVDDPNTSDVEEQKLAPNGDVLWTATAKAYGADWKFFDRSGTYELILDEYLGYAQIRKIQ